MDEPREAHPSAAPQSVPEEEGVEEPAGGVQMTASQLFSYADAARDAGDFKTAEIAYRALMEDPAPNLRQEARFRLARMLAVSQEKHREAAVLFRRILDEKPDATSVRLELARLLALMGNFSEARRELRAAQAAGLPAQVEQQLRFFANALTAMKRLGGGLEVALAPSTNVNRATASDTLGTIIGDFDLSEDAQAQSGLGLSLRGQAYYRHPLSTKTDILIRGSASTDFYEKSDFNDFSGSIQIGPQWRWGRDRFSLSGAASRRWYGGDPYSFSWGLSGNWQHPFSGRTQLRLDATVLLVENLRNDLEDGQRYTLAAGVDHAFSARAGGGLQIHGSRDDAADPGYSDTSGGANLYLYREMGRTTFVTKLGYRHLEADARLFLYPKRRIDDHFSAGISGTFRALTVGTFAPMARIGFERNWSTIEIYDFDRISGEFGVVAAF